MFDRSFLNKVIILIIVIVMALVVIFFVTNKKEVDKDLSNVELITSMNVNTFDEDLYIYKLENNTLYTSEYYFNPYYLANNEVEYTEFKTNEKTKFYLKTLSNTKEDVNNVKVSYDPINEDEFNYLLENYDLLKVYIWMNDDKTVKNVLLYSSNNTELVIVHY